ASGAAITHTESLGCRERQGSPRTFPAANDGWRLLAFFFARRFSAIRSLPTFGARALVFRLARAAHLRPQPIGDFVDDIFDLARHVLRHQANDRVHEPLFIEAAPVAPSPTAGTAATAASLLAT